MPEDLPESHHPSGRELLARSSPSDRRRQALSHRTRRLGARRRPPRTSAQITLASRRAGPSSCAPRRRCWGNNRSCGEPRPALRRVPLRDSQDRHPTRALQKKMVRDEEENGRAEPLITGMSLAAASAHLIYQPAGPRRTSLAVAPSPPSSSRAAGQLPVEPRW